MKWYEEVRLRMRKGNLVMKSNGYKKTLQEDEVISHHKSTGSMFFFPSAERVTSSCINKKHN